MWTCPATCAATPREARKELKRLLGLQSLSGIGIRDLKARARREGWDA